MKRLRRDAVVVGSGITGLACAHRLMRSGLDIHVMEREAEPGGVMRTVKQDGFTLEQGPFNVLVRSPEFAELLCDLGPAGVPVPVDRDSARNRYVLLDGELRRLPRSLGEALRTPILSRSAKWRALRGMMSSQPGPTDASIDDVIRRRFGAAVADRIASAISVGIWGAESDEIEAASAMPTLARIDSGRSPLLALLRSRSRRAAPGDAPRGMVSFAGGLGGLCAAIAAALGDAVQTSTAARSIDRCGENMIVRADESGEPIEIETPHVVLATGASAAASMLESCAPDITKTLRSIEHVSLTVMNIAFEREKIGHPLDGYGFLVPRPSRSCPVLGVLWASSVFPHHAPNGFALLRIFFGGTRHPALAHASDDELTGLAMETIAPLLAIRGEPALVNVARWPNAVPLYKPGHAARVERLCQLSEEIPMLHLAGSYAGGVSVNDCVARGVRIAERIAPAGPV